MQLGVEKSTEESCRAITFHIEGKKNNHLCYLLMRVPEFRKLYRNILEEILETKVTVDYMESKIVHFMRPYDHTSFLILIKRRKLMHLISEPEFILQFIRDRNSYLKKQLVNFN